MKILIISSEPYQFPESPLLGVFQKDLADALMDRKHSVSVLSAAGRSLRYVMKRLEGRALNDGNIEVYRNTRSNWFPLWKSIEKSLYLKRGMEIFEEYFADNGKPDVIHAHNALYAGELSILLKEKYRIPVVLTEHSSWILRKSYTQSETFKIKEIYDSCDAVVGVSRALSDVLSDYYGVVRPFTIPNLMPEDQFGCSPSGEKNAGFSFVNVASIDENKNQIGLIRAFSEFKKLVPASSFTFVGDGPKKNEAIKLARSLGISRDVFFLGSIPRVAVMRELAKHHAFVLGSKFETFGVALIEANAIGLPVLATPCGGANDIICPGLNGLLLADHKSETMLEGMIEIYERFHEFNSKKIYLYTFKRFSKNTVVSSLLEIYESVQ